MAEKVRLSLELSRELDEMLQEMADESATTKSEVLRRALALAKVAHDARKEKRYLGLVDDRRKLDTEIVGLP
jgi:predicted transcriptional regulator